MKSTQKILASTISVVLIMVLLLTDSCRSKKSDIDFSVNTAFTSVISAFTSGVISVETPIRIQLTQDYPEPVEPNSAVTEEVFSFNPKIKGQTIWIDSRTIEFRPDEWLKNGTLYEAKFYLSKIINVTKDLKTFDFRFMTIEQSFMVEVEGLKTLSKEDLKWYKLAGTVYSADVANSQEIEKVLKAKQGKKNLSIDWEHGEDAKSHRFFVDSVQRADKPGEVILEWDGSDIDIDKKGDQKIEVPALGDFKVIDVQVVQQPQQYLIILFSDPIQKSQNLDGLIRLENGNSLTFAIEDNEVKAFTPIRLDGSTKLFIESGIKNIMGYKLSTAQEFDVTFESLKPEVRFIGEGTILPNSSGLEMPFEAVNLKAVQVKVIQIYENNIAQFLQVNAFDGSQQIKRVGRLIKKQEINLTENQLNLGKWNTFSLDLSNLIKIQPGAIYRIEISFKKKDSLYPCDDTDEEGDDSVEAADAEENFDENMEGDLSYWDSYEDYYNYEDYDYYYYNWEDRDNPCSQAYFNDNRTVARNVLASDLGIIAKQEANNTLRVIVSNLINTLPISGVTVDALNYQRQVIGTGQTDKDGFASIITEGKPFLLVASKDEQRGYLKLDDGSSLSLSKFDVAGEIVQKGLKGYIYGERGVWRPGDTLFLNFVLEDKQNTLPPDHPVTFELVNPQGKIMKRVTKTEGINGFYNFTVNTDPSDITGNWMARVKVGGSVFEKQLKIETIKPNRLKIKLDFGTDKLSVSKPNVAGDLNVTWLHGAPARNLRANVVVILNKTKTQFSKFQDYVFDDVAKEYSAEELVIFDNELDNDGNATISAQLKTNTAPGMLKAYFTTRVFEEGGDFSVDQFVIPYSPYSSYVGIKTPKGDQSRGMLLTDTFHTVQVVTVDPDGRPVSRRGMDVKIYKIDWRWWWDASGDNLASYVSSDYSNVIYTTTASTGSDGIGNFRFKILYPEWGRYLIRVTDPVSGHITSKTIYCDWPGWAGRARKENPGEASMLSFSSNKEKYDVGEYCTITFPSSAGSRALVSLESGSRIINSYWVETKDKETTFNFAITEDMAPNIYVNLELLQPHAQTKNDLPIRLYGVIPILVEDKNTILNPVIIMDEVLKPGEEAIIKVKEQNGTPMTYTLALVDEGLLDLTRFATPNPWTSFYAREALGIQTWDLYDAVIGAYGGKIESIFAIGGDMEAKNSQPKSANRFKPLVLYAGPVELGSGKTNTHKFKLPEYVGAVRVMVVAGNQKAYGSTEKSVPVRKPLMVLATMPRVVGPGETIKLPVNVFAMESKIKNVEISVECNDFFTIVGSKTQSITFSSVGDKLVSFDLNVAEKMGIGKVKVIAKSGSETATYEVEINVRNPNPPITKFVEAVIEPGKTWEGTFNYPGIIGTNTAGLEISNIPPLNLEGRLKYLIAYPHGCIEQTTSAAFPQLFIDQVMELNTEAKDRIEINIKAAVSRLNSFVLPNGGMGYWPGTSDADDWATTYAGHFLLEAELQGYSLPIGFKQNWLKYQKRTAKNWSSGSDKYQYYRYRQDDLEQAYRLYTLALAKEADLSSMNRLKEKTGLSVQAKWRLAAAYVLAGQSEVAKSLTQGLPTEVQPYNAFNSTYGSYERDEAMILETLSLMGERARGASMAKEVSKELGRDYWMSTQSTAYCLLAISKFLGGEGTSSKLEFTYSVGGGKAISVVNSKPIAKIEISAGNEPGSRAKITNNSSGVIFMRITMEGIPVTGSDQSAENNLGLSVKYIDREGNPVDVSKLEQGTDFLAVVQVINPSVTEYYSNLALTQIFPSGWEIQNTRMADFKSMYEHDIPTYKDIRDDRVYSYFDLLYGKTKSFVIGLNAAYLGKFYLPAVSCEAMYNNKINARKTGQWVEVVKTEN